MCSVYITVTLTVINRAHFSVRLDILLIDANLHYMAIRLKLVG